MENIITTDIKNQEIIDIISKERLSSYNIKNDDNFVILLNQYTYNIKISEAFYPALSMLEIALRNRISNAIDQLICPDWLFSELRAQKLLLDNEYKFLQEAAKKLASRNKKITKGALITELSFGFWVNLCKKAYKTTIWDKKGVFDFTFPNFPKTKEMDRIKSISSKLKTMLQLRNRVFHHEIIINHPVGLQNCHSIIKEILSYISKEYLDVLKNTSNFDDIIKQKP